MRRSGSRRGHAATSCSACGPHEKLGLAGDAAEAYAKEIVIVDFEGPGDDDMFARIRRDFDAKGVAQSDHQIRRTMEELMAKAVEDVKAGR